MKKNIIFFTLIGVLIFYCSKKDHSNSEKLNNPTSNSDQEELETISYYLLKTDVEKDKKLPGKDFTQKYTNEEVGLAQNQDENAGYKAHFLGWYNHEDDQKWDFSQSAIGNIKLYAKWQETTLKITFFQMKNSQGQLTNELYKKYFIENQSIQKETNPTPPKNFEASFVNQDAHNANYKAYFLGWYEDPSNNKLDFINKKIQKNLNFYGRWSQTKKQPKGVGSKGRKALKKFLFDLNERVPANEIDVSEIKSMYELFRFKRGFNQDISGWDVSKVINMNRLFYGAESFNQDISGWNVSKVNHMEKMFHSAKAFNQPIGVWDVSKVTSMEEMFKSAKNFNQDLNSWDVSKIEDIQLIFEEAENFDKKNIKQWDLPENVLGKDQL